MSTKNPGKQFERNFKEAVLKEGIYIHRINDSDLSFAGGNSSYTPKSDGDFIFYYKTLFLIECKSTGAKSISIQRKKDGQGMIKIDQIESLTRCSQFPNVEACFLLNFRCDDDPFGQERTYILNIENFSEFLAIEDKSSINEKDIIAYGGIKMIQRKKRKYFTYETKELIDRYIEEKGVQVQW